MIIIKNDYKVLIFKKILKREYNRFTYRLIIVGDSLLNEDNIEQIRISPINKSSSINNSSHDNILDYEIRSSTLSTHNLHNDVATSENQKDSSMSKHLIHYSEAQDSF